MSNIRTFADELRDAVEQAATKRLNERALKRLRTEAPVHTAVVAQATAAENGDSSATSTQTAQTFPMVNGSNGSTASTNSTMQFAAPNSQALSASLPGSLPSSTVGLSQGAQGEAESDSSNLGQNGAKKTLVRQTSFEERLDAIVGNLDLSEVEEIEDTPLPPEEQSRKDFADRLDRRNLDEEMLGEMLEELQTRAASWGRLRRTRCMGLLLVHVSRASRPTRGAFIAKGLPLLGELLADSVSVLEEGPDSERHEASMGSMACLVCLLALSVGRAIMWEHRQTLGKAFDRLHRWCGREKTARAAELRAPCMALSRRWRQQPKPANTDTPQNKALRVKVLEMIKQGLEGADAETLKTSLPLSTVASEIEATLYAFHKGATADYRQHARMLRNNMVLVGNESLRQRILSGEIVAQELVNMDSRSLAPQTLQEQRKAAELEALKSVLILPGQPVAKPLERMASFDWRDETYNPRPKEEPAEASAPVAEKVSESAPPPVPAMPVAPPTPLPEEPGTPGIMRTSSISSLGAPGTPEAMATPAPDDEDEQAEDLIRYFSQSVR